MGWLRITRPTHGPRPDGPSHATFKSAPGKFVAHLSHIIIYAPGTHSLAAFKQLELFWVITSVDYLKIALFGVTVLYLVIVTSLCCCQCKIMHCQLKET